MGISNHYTPTENRILQKLSDGERHWNVDLVALLPDPEMGQVKNVRDHVNKLRGKLRPVGQDIVAERIRGKWYYRRILLYGMS